jgi:hypothetical protein
MLPTVIVTNCDNVAFAAQLDKPPAGTIRPMDPITNAIVAALPALASDLVSSAVKDAYSGLKSLVASKFGAASAVATSVDDLEANPKSNGRAMTVSEHMLEVGASSDAEIMAAANELVHALAQQKVSTSRVAVSAAMSGGYAGIVGAQTVSIGSMIVQGSGPQPPQTDATEKNSSSGSFSRTIKIMIGNDGDFATVGPSGHNRRRLVRAELSNYSTVEINNCKLDIVNLDPPNAGTANCLLKDDLSVGPRSSRFVDVAYYDIGTSQARPGDHIRLAVPIVGGFFAEAYAYANLTLIGHTFQLRLSRFAQVYDEVACVLYLDPHGVLKLDRDDGYGFARWRPNLSAPLFSDNHAVTPLYEAVIKAHDNLPRTLADFARTTTGDDDPNKLIIWWCRLLAPRITIFGSERPGTKLDVYSDHDQKRGYDFILEGQKITAAERGGKRIWENLLRPC